MARLVALLRGVNLGKTNRIAMADLRALLAQLGYADVRTHLQSGNALLTASDRPDAVAAAVAAGIRERFGLEVPVVVRTAAELADVVAANPLRDVATDGSRHQVIFLSQEPDAAALDQIDAAAAAPETFVARGREIHVWCPGGMQRSRLMKALGDRRIAPEATATVRNWNTVAKLHELAGDGS